MADTDIKKWYVVRAVSGQENKIRNYLLRTTYLIGSFNLFDRQGCSSCSTCSGSAGDYQDQFGEGECKSCPIGKYTSASGSTYCQGCNDPGVLGREGSTLAIAAKAAKECVCKEGFYDCPAG